MGQVKAIRVRNIEFGTGIPNICVPIVGKTREEILNQASFIVEKEPECIELRIDWYEEAKNEEKVIRLLEELRALIGDIVLLFTFRTKHEGGEQEISISEYRALCECVCESGLIDMLDVEAYFQNGLLQTLCEMAHAHQVLIVASNHDFNKTPTEQELVERLHFMDQAGADIPKLAVMPKSERDVLTLLSAMVRYRETGGEKPIITMAMGGDGVISRLAGEIFGSALTFAAGVEASAPGQISIDKVKSILNIIHEHR